MIIIYFIAIIALVIISVVFLIEHFDRHLAINRRRHLCTFIPITVLFIVYGIISFNTMEFTATAYDTQKIVNSDGTTSQVIVLHNGNVININKVCGKILEENNQVLVWKPKSSYGLLWMLDNLYSINYQNEPIPSEIPKDATYDYSP